jgi:hypothetical protein
MCFISRVCRHRLIIGPRNQHSTKCLRGIFSFSCWRFPFQFSLWLCSVIIRRSPTFARLGESDQGERFAQKVQNSCLRGGHWDVLFPSRIKPILLLTLLLESCVCSRSFLLCSRGLSRVSSRGRIPTTNKALWSTREAITHSSSTTRHMGPRGRGRFGERSRKVRPKSFVTSSRKIKNHNELIGIGPAGKPVNMATSCISW